MDKTFHTWAKRAENKDKGWLELMQEFPEYLEEMGKEVKGLYEYGKPLTVNTYNDENDLSQIIQFVYFEVSGKEYTLLQIHGGCDVRGGYTKPRMFHTSDAVIFGYDRRYIYCGKCKKDIADSAYRLGEDFEVSDREEDKGTGKVYVDKNGKVYCPNCGEELYL